MTRRNPYNSSKRTVRTTQHVVTPKRLRNAAALSQRTRGLEKNEQYPFAPPEDWHEPSEDGEHGGRYRIVVQPAGDGYQHVVTPDEIRQRLSELPAAMIEPLEVVQLSRMTRKKRSFPCYGMQWGSSLYLYPIESSLIEFYTRPPRPAQLIEARMYGGEWRQSRGGEWQLVWTPEAIKNYYLNNILIHELGHLLDNRNRSYTDRERYAEWFAIEHGYKSSRQANGSKGRRVTRRHHTS